MTFYAPVSGADEIRLVGPKLTGLAYPAQGPLCCALQLVSGDIVVRVVRADKFSENALGKGLRDGWCGFEVEPVDADFIFSDVLTLCCAISLKSLFVLRYNSWALKRKAQPMALRVDSLETLLNDASPRAACDGAAYWALLERSTKSDDNRLFLERLYLALLGRSIDGEALNFYLQLLRNGVGRQVAFNEVANSEEFASKVRGRFLSPFSGEFPVIPKFMTSTRQDSWN